MPLYRATLASVALADEPLRARLLAGIAVAIGGLALAFGESIALGDAKWALLAATACAVAPLASAIGNVSIKRRGQRLDPIVLNGWAMLGGGALLLAASAPTEDWATAAWTAQALGSIAYLAAIGSAVAVRDADDAAAGAAGRDGLLHHAAAAVRGARVRRRALRRARHAGRGRRRALVAAGCDRPVAATPRVVRPDDGTTRRMMRHVPQPAALRRAAVPCSTTSPTRGSERQRELGAADASADTTIRYARVRQRQGARPQGPPRGLRRARRRRDRRAATASSGTPSTAGRSPACRRVRDEDDTPTGDAGRRRGVRRLRRHLGLLARRLRPRLDRRREHAAARRRALRRGVPERVLGRPPDGVRRRRRRDVRSASRSRST